VVIVGGGGERGFRTGVTDRNVCAYTVSGAGPFVVKTMMLASANRLLTS
jgi:hypothetical protein